MSKHAHSQTCRAPEHHVHDAEGLQREVAAACDERGLRLTPLRTQVLGLIARSERPLKAYELLDQLRESRDCAAPPTIYRALDFLLANGFIHKLESINAFVGCHHPRASQHAAPFLICDRCHVAVELEDAAIVRQLEAQANTLGFVPHAQTLEVHGLCARCSGAA
jgi:Fur family zinc uptake transcriptional regulator